MEIGFFLAGIFINSAIAILLIYYAHIRPKRVKENETASFFHTHFQNIIQMLQIQPNEPETAFIARTTIQLVDTIHSLRVLVGNHSMVLRSNILADEETTFRRLNLAIDTLKQNQSRITLDIIIQILKERHNFWENEKRFIPPF